MIEPTALQRACFAALVVAFGLGGGLDATVWIALWLGDAMWHWPVQVRLNRLVARTAAHQGLLRLVVARS